MGIGIVEANCSQMVPCLDLHTVGVREAVVESSSMVSSLDWMYSHAAIELAYS